VKQAYTPALQVTQQTLISKVRELPLPGKALVKVGDRVQSDTAVLSAELPGDLTVVHMADRMGFDPEDIAEHFSLKDGDSVSKGELLCEINTFFGLFNTRLECPADGQIEFFTEKNAHLAIRHQPVPLSVNAYIEGVVSKVEEGKRVTIETEGALMQGIFGVGGERQGTIFKLDCANDQLVTAELLKLSGENFRDKIIIGGAQFDISALREAGKHTAAAIVTGSIDAKTLADYLGYEIGVSITGDEQLPSTLIVTEGFGMLPISKRVTELTGQFNGRQASVNGATQVRAGAMRPEVIIPIQKTSAHDTPAAQPKALDIGAPIRIVRVPYFGQFGTICELPHEPQQMPSGSFLRVLKARLDSGEEVVVPRANVELL